MSMVGWDMDPDIYGYPDFGLQLQTGRIFTNALGDVGTGQYVSYNPTGPLPMNCTFGWTGDQLALFRKDWESRSKLNFGAYWFSMTIPVPLPQVGLGSGAYAVHIIEPFQTSLAGFNYWKVSFRLDVDPSPVLVS